MPLRNLSLIVFLMFAGFCFGQTSPSMPPFADKSGVEGTIKIAPIHPGPERPGVLNSKTMANTAFVLTNQNGSTTEFTTDEHGYFKISVAPGHYTVSKKGPPTKIGRCGPFAAFVVAGQMTHVEWICDSGMR